MTDKQRVLSQIEHRETWPVPYTLSFEGDVAEKLDEHYGSSEWRKRLHSAIEKVPSPLKSVDEFPGPLYRDPYGTLWRVDRRPFAMEEAALPEASLRGYSFPDPLKFCSAEWEKKARDFACSNSDRFLVARFGFGLFERSWALRGFEQALIDSVNSPRFYEQLLEALTEHQLAIVERLLALPVDGIMFSDDWGYQRGLLLGAEAWRRYLKPRLARLYERVHRAGKTVLSHCCGSVSEIMPDLAEIGLDVLESVQPEAMDPYRLKARYGSALTFWGGLGSQSTIQFSKPEEIRTEVRKLCRELGRGGGYVLAPAKALQPGTPTENAAAVVEAFIEQAEIEGSDG